MQMVRFGFPAGNTVYVDSRQKRLPCHVDPNARFFKSLTRGGRIER